MRIGLFLPTLRRDYDRVQSAIWIRALQMVEPLRELGHDVSVNNPLRRYDVAIYHRGMKRRSVSVVRLLRRIAKRVYWDTCVDYFERHEAADQEQVDSSRTIAGLVDGICVPTAGIADSAQRYSDNVFVMPDPVNLQHFAAVRSSINWDGPVFGWSGVACKATSLDGYAAFLDGRSRIIAETAPVLSFRYDFERWRHAEFPAALRRCDVAFLPRLLGSTYTVNNSSFKALAFAVLGLPIIATRLPSYAVMAEDYDGIVFLEDFGDDPAAAFDAVRRRNLDPTRVRRAYDRFVWAERLADWCRA
ncbi:MAG: hypothetical protein RBS99_10930 [Rhodospirillales bacterium]|jgi:hypothetical protein|nr:hypothetical protein [Rhodospirillales bacterium]